MSPCKHFTLNLTPSQTVTLLTALTLRKQEPGGLPLSEWRELDGIAAQVRDNMATHNGRMHA